MVGDALRRGRIEDLHHLALVLGPTQELGGAGQVVRPEHHIDPADLLLDQLTVLLCQATTHGNLHTGPGIDQRLEAPERSVQLLVGILPDTTSVQHHDIGLLHVVGLLHAVGYQHAGQSFGVVLVHLAPESADDEILGHWGESTTPPAAPPYGGARRRVLDVAHLGG